jgi:hypothetical protein
MFVLEQTLQEILKKKEVQQVNDQTRILSADETSESNSMSNVILHENGDSCANVKKLDVVDIPMPNPTNDISPLKPPPDFNSVKITSDEVDSVRDTANGVVDARKQIDFKNNSGGTPVAPIVKVRFQSNLVSHVLYLNNY